jgi:hypothetical protein
VELEVVDDDQDEEPASNPRGSPTIENARENLTAQTLASDGQLVILSTVVDTPIQTVDPNINLSKLTIKKAYELYGVESTNSSIDGELKNMLWKGVFNPVSVHDQGRIPRTLKIPFMLFLKYKDGKLKSHLVAGGHLQDDEICDRLSSPTIKLQTIFCLAAFAAENMYETATFDVTCAYLNASRSGQTKLYMRLNKDVTARLVKLDKSYSSEVLMTIYGTIEAANLWYNEASDTLVSLGFIKSLEDPCLFIGKDILVGLYVDDFFVISKSRAKMERLKRDLSSCYDEIKSTFDAKLKFLGMNFEFIESQVRISIPLDEILKDIQGVKPTPAGMNLFIIDENSDPLSEGSKEFHSMVAKLLYIAKRTRADIFLPVNFLATRVKVPTVSDLGKLKRILQFLNGSADEATILSMNCDNVVVTLDAYIDACPIPL